METKPDPVLDTLMDEGKADTPVKTGGTTDAAPGQTPPGETAPETPEAIEQATAEKARKALGLKEKLPDTLDALKLKYEELAATDGKRSKRLSAMETKLAEAGLTVHEKDDGTIEFAPDSKYVDQKAEDLAKKLSVDLTPDDRELAHDNPAKFMQMVIAKALSQTASAKPTIRAEDIRIPKAMQDQIRKALGKDAESFPDYADLEPYINQLLEDGTIPDAVKSAMLRDKDAFQFGLTMLYGHVSRKVGPILSEAKQAKARLAEKAAKAKGDISLTSEGDLSRRSSAKSEADEIVKAGGYR